MLNRLLALAVTGLLMGAASHLAFADEVIRIADVPRDQYQRMHEMGDFWSVDSKTGDVIMYVTARQRAAIEALGYEVRLDEARMRSLEYARSIDTEAWRQSGVGGIPGFACYRTVDETKADLSAMATQRPDLARWASIGETWLAANGETGGDDLYVLVLGNQNSPHQQPPFILMAAQHARELTTAETATRFAEWLFENYDSDPTARWLLDHREIHIIAQQNPDGRREIENDELMWRKNSNLSDVSICGETVGFFGDHPGVDLNRNSNFFWGDFSGDGPCEQTYRGTSAASEPETQAVQNYMQNIFENHWPGESGNEPVPADADGLFISLHSYSELILFPWEGSGEGTDNNAPNHDQLAWLGRKFGFFTGYEVGRDILYSAGGTTTDYAHGKFGVAAYTYEIGTEFLQSCSYFENNMWEDLRKSLIYAAKASHRPYQAPSGPDIVNLEGSYDRQSGQFRVSGLADDSRFNRGTVTEAPASDPVSSPVEVLASFGLPPLQAPNPVIISLAGSGNSQDFEFNIDPPEEHELPALLFLQAVDREGHTGVPEAIWVPSKLVFSDYFETGKNQ